VEPGGVDEEIEKSALALAACFAAFSARRFCFDAEGGIAVKNESLSARSEEISESKP
jgi:hypothetical protein